MLGSKLTALIPALLALALPSAVCADAATTVLANPQGTLPLTPQGNPTQSPAALRLKARASSQVVSAGASVRFALTLTDSSTSTAQGAVLCDSLPAGTLYLSSSRPADFHGAQACFALGALHPGQSSTMTITLLLDPSARGAITDHALASAANASTVYAQAKVKVRAKSTSRPAPVTG